MNTILIATDFSKASLNASLCGVQLAKATDANIILFNAYLIPNPLSATVISISGFDVMMQTKQHLTETLSIINRNAF